MNKGGSDLAAIQQGIAADVVDFFRIMLWLTDPEKGPGTFTRAQSLLDDKKIVGVINSHATSA